MNVQLEQRVRKLENELRIISDRTRRVSGMPIIKGYADKQLILNDHLDVLRLKAGIKEVEEAVGDRSNGVSGVNGTPHRLAIFDANGKLSTSLIRKNGLLYELLDEDGYGYLAFGQDESLDNVIRSSGYFAELIDEIETGTPGVYHQIFRRLREYDSELGHFYRVIIDGRLTVLDVPELNGALLYEADGEAHIPIIDKNGRVTKSGIYRIGPLIQVGDAMQVYDDPDSGQNKNVFFFGKIFADQDECRFANTYHDDLYADRIFLSAPEPAETASTVLTRVGDEVQEVPISALDTEMSDADFLAKMKSMLVVEHPLKLVE
ncbi:MAG: hypothetical protein ACOC36_03015, partial [Fibrobacterota bacterium]